MTNPFSAAGRIDFSIDPDTALWRSTPLDQVAGLLTESAQQYAIDLLATADLTTAMAGGVGPVRTVIADGRASDARLAETGIAVVGVRGHLWVRHQLVPEPTCRGRDQSRHTSAFASSVGPKVETVQRGCTLHEARIAGEALRPQRPGVERRPY